jgi:hypothetical protein
VPVLWWSKLGKHTLAFAGLWIALYTLAGFSVRQTTAIVVIAGVFEYALWVAKLRPSILLVPHRIHIQPRWFAILSDLELIATPEEYDQLHESFSSLPPGQYNVFRDGVCFTVLTSKHFGQRTLVYSNDFHTFVSEVDFERGLAPLTVADESPLRNSPAPLGPTSPRLFVRYGGGGCSMGVIVHDWWWEKRKESVTAKTGKLDAREAYFDCGLIRLTLADISVSEFTLYWERLRPYPKGDQVWEKRRLEDHAKFGWTDKDNSPEARRHEDFRLEHKYFYVRHHSI